MVQITFKEINNTGNTAIALTIHLQVKKLSCRVKRRSVLAISSLGRFSHQSRHLGSSPTHIVTGHVTYSWVAMWPCQLSIYTCWQWRQERRIDHSHHCRLTSCNAPVIIPLVSHFPQHVLTNSQEDSCFQTPFDQCAASLPVRACLRSTLERGSAPRRSPPPSHAGCLFKPSDMDAWCSTILVGRLPPPGYLNLAPSPGLPNPEPGSSQSSLDVRTHSTLNSGHAITILKDWFS